MTAPTRCGVTNDDETTPRKMKRAELFGKHVALRHLLSRVSFSIKLLYSFAFTFFVCVMRMLWSDFNVTEQKGTYQKVLLSMTDAVLRDDIMTLLGAGLG